MFHKGSTQVTDPVQSHMMQTALRYFILLNGQSKGPYPLEELRRLPGFTLQSHVRTSPLHEWKPAFMVVDLKSYVGQAPTSKDKDRVIAEARRRTAANARKAWMAAAAVRIQRFFRLFVVALIVTGLGAVALYIVEIGAEQRHRWKMTIQRHGHTQIQDLIRGLTRIDHRFFTIAATGPIHHPVVSLPARTAIPPAPAPHGTVKPVKSSRVPHR